MFPTVKNFQNRLTTGEVIAKSLAIHSVAKIPLSLAIMARKCDIYS